MNRNKKKFLQTLCLAFALALTVWGITRGEVSVIFNKAINICLECIGLG